MPKGKVAGLTLAQERAVVALLEHSTLQQAAKAADVSVRSLYGWMRDPDFRDALATRKSDILQEGLAVVVRNIGLAARTLAGIAGDEDAPHGSRVAASRALLETGLRWYDQRLIEERLASLERRLFGEVPGNAG